MGLKKRTNYLINKNFQLMFIFYTLIPSIFSLSIFYFSIRIYFSKLIKQGIEMGLPLTHPYFTMLSDQQNLMNNIFYLCSFFTIIFYCGWGMFISHKIAGPLFRLTRFFDEIDSDHFDRELTFRPGDFFQEIPTAINKWMKKFKKK